MAISFPTGLDDFINPTSTDATNSLTVPHAAQHANINDAVEALEAKVGIDNSAVTTSHDYKIAANATAITTEASARASADTTLQSNINSEATARAAGDTAAIATAAADATTKANAAQAAAIAASQPLDSDLTAIAGLSPANDDVIQRKAGAWANRTIAQLLTDLAAAGTTFQPKDTTLDTYAGIDPSANVQSILSAADYAAIRTLLGLVIGTNVQAYDAELAALAGTTSAADKLPYYSGAGTATTTDLTSVARTLLAQTTQALMRSTGLGLGTIATQDASNVSITGGSIGSNAVIGTSRNVNTDHEHSATNQSGGTAARVLWAAINDVANYLAMIQNGSGNTSSAFGQTIGSWGQLLSHGGSGLMIGTDGGTPVALGANNAEIMRLLSAGRVLIGTTSDDGANKLQVNGSIAPTTIELGHASDTTLSRSSAGVLAVEGVTVPLNSTTNVHTAQQIELGHASDTTISRSSAGVIAVEGVAVPTISSTSTLTNKRITKRVVSLTDAATVTPDADTTDVGVLTSLSQTTTFANPTGTPTSEQVLVIKVKSTTTRSVSFGANFRASANVSLPTATTGSSKTDRWMFCWNNADSKWDIMAADNWT